MRRPTAVTACLLAAGCIASPTAPRPQLNQEFSLAAGHEAVVQGTGIVVRFVEVTNDSRCPVGAMCIVAGNAQISLAVAPGYGPEYLVLLNTTDPPREAMVAGYFFELRGLTPVPRVDQAIPPTWYVAVLRVRPGLD